MSPNPAFLEDKMPARSNPRWVLGVEKVFRDQPCTGADIRNALERQFGGICRVEVFFPEPRDSWWCAFKVRGKRPNYRVATVRGGFVLLFGERGAPIRYYVLEKLSSAFTGKTGNFPDVLQSEIRLSRPAPT